MRAGNPHPSPPPRAHPGLPHPHTPPDPAQRPPGAGAALEEPQDPQRSPCPHRAAARAGEAPQGLPEPRGPPGAVVPARGPLGAVVCAGARRCRALSPRWACAPSRAWRSALLEPLLGPELGRFPDADGRRDVSVRRACGRTDGRTVAAGERGPARVLFPFLPRRLRGPISVSGSNNDAEAPREAGPTGRWRGKALGIQGQVLPPQGSPRPPRRVETYPRL